MTGGRPMVQVIGDGMNGDWLTWCWNRPDEPMRVHRTSGLAEPLRRFHAALPSAHVVALEDLRLDGPLTRFDSEYRVMRDLAQALLPAELVEQLLAASERIDLRVMPSPPLARIPWGLLPIDGDRRLVEVADVSWIAPILPRDTAADPPPPRNHAKGAPLYLLDPIVTTMQQLVWDTLTPAAWGAQRPGAVRMPRLSTDLAFLAGLNDDISRIFLVGHASRTSERPGEVDFLIGQGRLSAADLLLRDVKVPPRAAIVACASGTDLEDSEPLGLATGLLLRGADTVQATLWPLPTDHALAQRDAAGGFLELVGAFDEAQESDDPTAALCQYQVKRLRAWREEPMLRNSPIVWGAAMTLTAPRERHLSSAESTLTADDIARDHQGPRPSH